MLNIDNTILDTGLMLSKYSPCIRRKYCAQIISSDTHWSAVNERISSCCDGTCIREVVKAPHGQMVERGAEVHAEQLVLSRWTRSKNNDIFYLSGIETSTGAELRGVDSYPCHVCAIMIKAAGFTEVVLRDGFIKIEDIIRVREQEWISS